MSPEDKERLYKLLSKGKEVLDDEESTKIAQQLMYSFLWGGLENEHLRLFIRNIGKDSYDIFLAPKDDIGNMIAETWENLKNAKDEDQKRNYEAILKDLIFKE